MVPYPFLECNFESVMRCNGKGEKEFVKAREKAQQLGVPAALPEHPGLVSSKHVGWLTTSCNTKFRRSKTLLYPPLVLAQTWHTPVHVGTYIHTHTHMHRREHTLIKKINLLKSVCWWKAESGL